MYNWLSQLVHLSNGRPFSPDEVNRIGNYADGLRDAVIAVKKLEENQKWLVRHLSEAMGGKAQDWGLPRDPFTTDFAAFLASIGHAVLSQDLDILDHTVVQPCASLADALEIPRHEFGLLFQEAWRILAPRLDPTSSMVLVRYFDRASERLRESHEPTVPQNAPAMMEVLS
jgi:hypothetical protein